ncbi:hypothetical protein T4D_16505 [Trichinella pseudospiralis]|uniref:Uncharacterized protein n=1 Tax=Trichinella pseudospiralis TaxID=6337 RepID=A0A0V1DMP1_TRIPS|nr:hypothetical protein T4D_16505 [Trichinella pseudospiralis]
MLEGKSNESSTDDGGLACDVSEGSQDTTESAGAEESADIN